MTEGKVSSSDAFSPRSKKASAAEDALQNGDMDGAGDIRTFEFDECSGDFGVVLENKDPCSPSRARTALGNIRIADLLPDSRAKRDGMLEVGDRVMEINGRDLSKASLERARWYLGSALRSGKLKMKVLRGPAGRNITPVKNGVVPRLENNSESSGSKNRVKKIHILKDSRGLGVQILMKLNHETGEKGVFVSDVSPGGAAARDGRLKEGDELLWINGHSLIGVTQQEAVDLLRASPKLIQLVISTQVRGSTLEKKAMASRLKKSSLDNVTDRAGMQGSKSLPQAKSAESLVQKGRKMSSGHMGKKIKEADKKFEKGTTESQDKVLQQSMESSPSKIVENLNPQKDNQIEETGLQDKSHNEGNHALLNGNEQELINGRHWSSSSDGSNGQEKSDTKDVLLSKGEESLESEPVTLEDKPLSKGSSTKSLLGKLPSLSPPIIDASKKRNSPNLFLNNSPPKEKPTKSGMRLEPGQISPSLPRPQSPGGMGIAFSARYLGDPPANVMTKAMPTPQNFVGSNDRDSPQAKKKGSNETSPRRTSKTMKEEVVTIVLVKGMNGKGLGFTIVGGKGSPHGDMAVHVRNILPGGAAEADGRMRKGDEVLSVNETSFEGFTHQQALDTFKNLRRGIVTLKVRRNSPGAPSASTFTTPRNSPGRSRRNSRDVTAESTSSSNSSSPTMFRKLRQKRSQKDKISEIVLYKEPGSSLGIGLGEQHPSTQIPGIFVQCIIQGTPADNDGRLRKGDQLLEVNDKKLEGLSVENIYNILDKTPPGKVYFKVVQNNASDKLPLQLNDELTKLQSERQFLDKKMSGKSKSSGTASTLSGASESSESCDNFTSLSSSCDLLIPHSVEQNKKKKSQTVQESDDDVFTHEPDSAEFLEDIYTIIKQPTGGLGMGVTVDKSRGNTIAEGVSIKSVTEGGSAALARGSRGVGLKLGDQIIAVNGTHLRGMDQEDVIKIFRDLPSSTQMKIRRSKMTLQGMDSNQRANKSNEPSDKTVPQDLTPLPKPPDSKRRSSRRGKVKPGTQEERSPSSDKTDKVPSSGRVKAKKESDTPHKEYIAEKKDHNGIKDVRSSDDQERSKENEEEEARSTKKSPFKEQIKPVADVISTSKYLTNKNSEKVKDQLGDNLIIPSGYRKVEINIKKEANSTLGLSLVPSYGNLKGYFQIRRLQSGMVCAQDRQLQTGDKLVSVNGVSLKGVTHSMALQLLKKPTELVTFVILREGEDPQERVSSPFSEWKSDLSSGQNYTLAQDSGTHGELSSSSRREEAKTLPCAEKAVSPSKSQWSRELKKLESRDEPHSRSNEDRNIEEDIPELPSSPPPPPLLDADDLLENDLSIALPSFSPPPPPVPPPIDDVLPLSPIPVVSPPPILSPRMKEFLEQDPFRADRHESNNIQDDEISPESSISLNQACFRGNKTGTGWDFQSLLDACNDLNTNENDDEFISGQTTSTEATSLSGNCKPSLPSETMKTKDTFSEKLLETSTGSPAEESGHEQQNLDLEKLSAKPKFGVDKGLLSPVKGPNTKKMTTPSIIKHKIDVDVKPVAGRRDENVPFAIIYQKKFRNLGFKVDLTEEGKVIVSDVSSFGLVGKDGNIRVGDFLLSINETPLEGMAFEDVHNMIKNCPRGDVRIVAQAGPKPPKPTELLEEKVSSQKEKGELDEIPDKMSSADRESVPDVLSSVAAYTPWVDISSELISLKTSKTFSGPVSNLPTTNHIPDPEESVTSITLSQELTDELIAAEGCEGSELEGTEFDDLPPSSPPPPLPTDDAEEEEDYSGEVPELLTEDIVENLSLNPPANFEDFVDENLESALSFDSEVEEANTVAPQPPQLFSQDAQSPPSYPVQKKEYFNGNSDIPSGSQEKQKQLTENLKQQAPMKPPRLFGDNIGNESIHKEEPLELMNNSFVQDAAALESLSWNGQDKSPIKPPSLFDDELESLPSLPRGPPPPKPRRQVISQDTVSSTSSSPLLSCWFDRESSSHLPNLESTNLMAESGLSSPSHEHTSIFGIPDAFSDAPIQLLDDLDDDMSSLPPAPPPPRSQVNMSSSWSVESDKSVPSSGGETQLTHITSPLPHPVKPERKNSKKRTLSLPIRSKRGSKTSEQSGSSGKGDELHESPAYPSQVDFVAPITSSDDNQAHSLTHDEPPEDDMESLPPAPPPPRISPLTMESLESFGDGLQAVKVKTSPGLSASEEDKAKSSSVNASQSSPKKKKKSFRRNVIEMEAEGSIPEFRGVSVKFPVVHETDHAADGSLKQDVTPREDEVAVTDSSDAMSPPPLPPEMELWSEAGAAEAELAFLDQILTLEDLSHSGSEQDSEGGSSSSSKPPSLSTEMSNLDTKSSQSKEGSTVNTSQETHGHTYSMMSTEGLGQTNIAFSSLEESSDTGSGGIPDLEPMNLSSSINSTEANPESELHYPPLDLKGRTESNATHFKPKDRLLKQPTKGEDSAENFTKQRRPAPPIPSRPPGKTSGAPRKSLPGGIPVLPSKPDVKLRATSPPQESTQKLKKEQERLSSPVKEKTSKKLFSRGHKGKDKKADPDHLQSPDTSFDANPVGRERSRSWTKKLFGFRSRSRSKNRDKPKDGENRSRSVSPPRGLFSRSRRSSPPLPPPTTKKDPLGKQKKDAGVKDPVHEDVEKPIFNETKFLSQTLPFTFKSSDLSTQMKNYVERNNNNKFGVLTTKDEDMRPEVATNEINFQQAEDGSSIEQDESCSENADLDHEEKEYEIDIEGVSLFTDDDDVTESHVYAGVDTSLANRPPSPKREKQPNTSALITAEYEERKAVKDNLPTKSPYKPPVPKKPTFLKSVGTHSRQQQETMDELKQKISKERMKTSPLITEDLDSDTEGKAIEDSNVLPSPGPPNFKAVPPPLAVQASSSLAEKDDFSTAPHCPNSPGPPRFKPPPPPLSLKPATVQNDTTGDETSDSPVSPGPPNFKPAPPPIDLLVQNKSIDCGNEDLPRTTGAPTAKPLPPIPVLGKSKKREDVFPAEQGAAEDTYDVVAPALHNEEPRKTKPLPPVPTDLNLNTTGNPYKLTLSRQNAQEVDKNEDLNNPEIWEQNTDPSPSQILLNEYNDYPQLSQGAEPVVTQNVSHEVNAHSTDDFDSSDVSSEWEDTCSSTQEYSGQPLHGNKVARSASFSAGDVPMQRPSIIDEETKRSTPVTKRPPPFFRRRSSSLPQLLADSLTGQASEGKVGQADYWHTGNLQQLIDSRNQEEDVEEGILEVQLLKEQKSIGLMVVGGLDTHLGMLYIKNIQPNSPAANCNRLRVGDQLLQVNDNCLVGVTHSEALNILKNTPPLVKLTVARKKDNGSDNIELVAEGRRVPDAEEPIVSSARESSTISKTASDLPLSPPLDRGQRPKSLISLSSFGASFNNDSSPASPSGSFDDSDDYIPAYLEPESPTLTLRQDDVPVTIIDGIPGEYDSTTTEDEEEVKPVTKSVTWAVSSDDAKVFTVELLKNGRAGLGLSVTGGVDTPHDDIMVRQILSNSVTADNGHIKKGDILLSVNGKSFKGLTNLEALTLLKNTPERVTLVVSRPLGHRQQSKTMTLLRNKSPNKEITSDSDAWPTKEELTKKKNMANSNNTTPPTLEKIPLDVVKHNGEHSTFDRLKKRFFSNGGPIRLQKVPHGPSVTELTLEKGASGLGFSLGGGQDSLYGDAPIHVRYVFKESVAGRSGALKPGDEIIEVNGQKVAYMANVDVLELIRKLPYGPVVMKIRRK